jgi:lysophospholipase L1-like esterase
MTPLGPAPALRGPLGRRLLACLAGVVLLASGCTPDGVPGAGEPPSDEPAGEPGRGSTYQVYAALGDSFTAAPLVPATDLADGCLRSDGNYPSLLAERLGVAVFRDVSCSGAATDHVSRPQPTVRDTRVPPQLRAVRPDTDLVTLGIGGNDFGLFQTLVATCSRLGRSAPTGSPCADALAARGIDLVAVTGRIEDRVARSVDAVRTRAPRATVVVVGYPRLTRVP